MPEISRFFGIVIAMYYEDHLPPHFHARYAGRSAAVEISTAQAIAGGLPSRALGMVEEWAVLHRHELMENWERARRREPLLPIAPLE